MVDLWAALQLLQGTGTELLECGEAHATVDAWAIILKNGAATIIITNLAMPRHPIQTEVINLRLSGAPTPALPGSNALTTITQIRASLGIPWANLNT
jgi:hypothetical protein